MNVKHRSCTGGTGAQGCSGAVHLRARICYPDAGRRCRAVAGLDRNLGRDCRRAASGPAGPRRGAHGAADREPELHAEGRPAKNPHNDVELVGAPLKQVGFSVTILKDAIYKQMDSALKRYATEVRRAGRGTLSFFYYSGHGVANPENQLNYLIPVDVADADDDKVWFESLQQNVIIDLLSRQAQNATHYVVFDACRNELNVGGSAAKSLGTDKGFVPVADTSGLLIAYATAPKKTASDAGQGGGPYAKALAEELVRPGVESVSMFRNVQIRVKQSIGQDPWLWFPSLPPVYLAGRDQPATPSPAPAAPARTSDAAEAWSVAEKSTDPAVLEAYIRRFGETFYGDLAKSRLATMRDERQRVALLQKQEEDRKRAKADAAAKATEAKHRADDEAAARARAAADLRSRGETAKGDPALTVKPGSGQSFRDCPDCPEMVVVPAGSFMMGSPENEEGRSGNEGPQRRVTIARPFAVGKFEVTFAEWDACVSEGGCTHRPDNTWGRGRRPAMNVSWDDITKQFLPWLATKAGRSYRLLTEAEWEYAARAGKTTPFSFGATISADQANYNGTFVYGNGVKGAYRQFSIEVGSLNKPNAWGLHDMHGNASEWVEDCWHDNFDDAPSDGSAWASQCSEANRRVHRGGSWRHGPVPLRSASRSRFTSYNRDVDGSVPGRGVGGGAAAFVGGSP
ncbi:MAG: SUMF1/EgtB/PvdO family nonheme iron enzyme [Hyphomicrobiales bacterium]|nr:SUMF1/EgtB/PvdO family nonheme iron enzyme [Hyphomicrobiales bacterium]